MPNEADNHQVSGRQSSTPSGVRGRDGDKSGWEVLLTPDGFKRWRWARGLSQAETADLLGVVQRTVSGWETGEYRIPLSVVYAVRYLSQKRRR